MKLSSVICLFATSITGVICSGEDLVKQYVEQVWNAHNPSALKKFIQPDYVRRAAVFPRLPRVQEERHVGIEHFSNYLTRVFKSMPDLTVELEDVIGEGNQVYYTFISKGTQYSTSWGQASGKYMEAKCAAHHRLDEVSGKIAFSEIFCDFAGIIQHFAPSPVRIDLHRDYSSGSSGVGYSGTTMMAMSSAKNAGQGSIQDHHGIVIDNLEGGIERILTNKVLNLMKLFRSENISKQELLKYYDTAYQAISPAFPETATASEDIDFNLAMRKCISSKDPLTAPVVQINRFYFDDMSLGGIQMSWTLSGTFSNKCPAPYNQYTPTQKQIRVHGVSYLRFNESGKLIESKSVWDNTYLKENLAGKVVPQFNFERYEL